MRKWFWVGMVGWLLGRVTKTAAPEPVAAGATPLRVLLHIDEAALWPRVLANVGNLAARGAEVAQIEVLVNGAAAAAVDQSVPQNRALIAHMQQLAQEYAVDFVVCANSLAAQHIGAAKLPRFYRVVPVGVLELAQQQQQGYGYIKP